MPGPDRLLSIAVLVCSVLACQVGATPAPPPPLTATALPLPTVAVPTRAIVTLTPLAVVTHAPTATGAETSSSIRGWVWHDLCEAGTEGAPSPATPPPGCLPTPSSGYRANGAREPGEPALPGIVVRLGTGACPSTGLAESSTAATGPSYVFDGLQPGTYCVSVDPFAEPNRSHLIPGQWTYPGVAAGLLGQTVSLAPGQSLLDTSFGWDYQFLPVAAVPTASGCTYAATFIRDVTVPANTVVPPGATFVKTWQVANSGTCHWGRAEDAVRSLVLVGGTPLGAPERVALTGAVPPGLEAGLSITFTAPAAPGTYLSEWMLLAEPGTRIGVGPGGAAPLSAQIVVTTTTVAVRPGATFHAQRLASPPSVDAAFGDWAGLPYNLNTAAYRPENWTGLGDHSAAFALGWDDAYLYLALRVTDDVYVQTQTGETLFRGDSVELLFDTNLVGDYSDTTLNDDDYQLGLSAGANRSTPEAFLWFPTSRRGRADVLLIPRPDGSGQGYLVEAGIPWALLAVAPVPGTHLGFALSSSDNDTPANAEQQSMLSTEAGRRLTDPTTWGTLILDP